MRRAAIFSGGWIGGCALAVTSFSAIAEETPPAMTSPEKRQNEVPSGGNDEKPKPRDAQNLGKEVTGVFVNAPVGQGGYAPSFMFRGFDNGGLTLRDGVARGFISGDVELAGTERIEFVKGVTSMLYGTKTSASGAAANYITKKPEPDFFLRSDATIGSFGFHRATLDLNSPLSENKNVLFRFNAAVQDKKSFVDFVHSDNSYLNPSLTFVFENGDRLSLRGEYSIGHSLARYGVPTYLPSPIFLHLPRNFYAAVPANERGWVTKYDGRLKYEHDFDRDWSAALVIDYYSGFGASGWLTAWQFDGVRSISLGNGARTHEFLKNFDAQASLKGRFETGFLTHNVFLGYERWAYYDRHRDRITADALGSLDIFAPIYPAFVNYAFARPANGDDSGWTNSAFAQDLIEIGPQWSVLIGGRYDYLASYQTLNDPTGALTGTPGSTASKGFNPKVSPRGGVVFRPFDNTSIHAAYGQSFIPNLGVRIAGGKLAPPEEDTLYEIGMRQSLFSRKVDIDLGVFDVTRKHVPSADPFNPNGFYSLVTGQQHSHGIEASASAQVTPNLRVGVAATFLHALVTEDSNTPSQKGSDLLGALRRVFNISASYSFDIEPLRGLEIGANFYYASETQATLPNTHGFTLSPIKNFSLSASFRLNNLFSLSLSASNLTDSANFTSNGALFYGEPRSVSASLSYKY
jgi:iron complex outermembrane recepter protein